MNVHTDVQIIRHSGKPVFVVVPYKQWLEITGQETVAVYIPHEVVGLQLKEDLSLIAAWRKYKGLSQKILAEQMGISQPAMAQIEKRESKPQKRTLQKIAALLEVEISQLIDAG